ncbi:MAG: DUF58 domain-containing protein [Glaciecola sp.]|jgi:uncharacterized protein (DUF58 family)
MSLVQQLQDIDEHAAVALSVTDIMAYKHIARMVGLRPRAVPEAKLSGGYVSKIKGRGMEFDEVRHYQAGDDIRSIDWRVTARTGKTHTKVYREERERPVYIVTDVGATMQFGSVLMLKSVLAGHLTSLLAWAAKQRGDRVGGLVFNDLAHREIKPTNRDSSILHLLSETCALQQAQPLAVEPERKPLGDALQRVRRLAKPGSLICIISDFHQLDETGYQDLVHLRKHNEIRCFAVSDPLENGDHLDQAVTLFVTDGIHEEQRAFGGEALGQTPPTSQWLMRLQTLGIPSYPLTAGESLVSQLPTLKQYGALD